MTSITLNRESVTVIECSECGGHYYAGRNVITGETYFGLCHECGHTVAERDITLDWDERIAWDREGRLGYTTVEWGE